MEKLTGIQISNWESSSSKYVDLHSRENKRLSNISRLRASCKGSLNFGRSNKTRKRERERERERGREMKVEQQ